MQNAVSHHDIVLVYDIRTTQVKQPKWGWWTNITQTRHKLFDSQYLLVYNENLLVRGATETDQVGNLAKLASNYANAFTPLQKKPFDDFRYAF